MHIRTLMVLASLFVWLYACEGADIHPVQTEEVLPVTVVAATEMDTVYAPADSIKPVPFDTSVLRFSCSPHSCNQETDLMPLVDWLAKPGADWAIFQCPDGSRDTIPSDTLSDPTACWRCNGQCASPCPAGAECRVVPESSGSDCRALYCPAGYSLVAEAASYPNLPQCMKEVEVEPVPPEVSILGPTAIPPEDECMWTAQVAQGTGTGPISYTWYNNNLWSGTGPTYTGGMPNGSVNPWFKVRVVVQDSLMESGSDEIVVDEDSGAFACPS